MKFCVSEFKFIDRGFKDTLVLIPGWATDWRIFDKLCLDYNYLLPVKFNPFNFKEGLLEELNKTGRDKISLFGYSLGGFLASEFALNNPERIKELILVSIRKRYDLQTLQDVEVRLRKNKRAYLREFYFACFSADDKENYLWFKKNLLKDYAEKIELESLLVGLAYLRQAEIDPKGLAGLKKVRIFHGENDNIAPLDEAIEIKSNLPQVDFSPLAGAGHLLFLNPGFKDKFNNG